MMWRTELKQIKPDYHGAIDFAELAAWGIAPDDVLDFSVNSNPYGSVQAVLDSVAAAPIDRYPDKACLALRAALEDHLGVASERIHVGNGSSELIWLLCFARLRRGDDVLVIAPTFGEYARNAKLMGAHVHQWQADAADDFAVDVAAIDHLLTTLQPSLFFLCNPNNPTGQIVALETLDQWAQAHPDTLFVIDEAYQPFVVDMPSALSLTHDNLIVLRSMTKDYALAGLRLGYIVGSTAMIESFAQVQITWSVNGVAQAAGIAALEAHEQYEACWARLRRDSADFRQSLQNLGYRPVPSPMHYFLVDVGDGRQLRERLLRHGMLVRLCESYQLPQFVRIATRTPTENQQLLHVLAEWQKREGGCAVKPPSVPTGHLPPQGEGRPILPLSPSGERVGE